MTDDQKRLQALENQVQSLLSAELVTLRVLYRLVRSLDTADHPDCKKLASLGQALNRLRASIEKHKH
jgi:hypothetical protein